MKAAMMILTAAVGLFAFGAEYELKGNSRSLPDDLRCDMRPGLRMSCRVKFAAHPSEVGQMTFLRKGRANSPGSFWLRVDGGREKVAFSFFVNLGTGPEPRVSVLGAKDIEIGKWYDVSAGWDGTNTWITVNGTTNSRRRVCARPFSGCAGPIKVGPLRGIVADPMMDSPALGRPIVSFGMFRTQELMPRLGSSATLKVDLLNFGTELGPCTVVAKGKDGVSITPARIEIASLDEGESRSLQWRVDAGTIGLAFLEFAVKHDGRTVAKAGKRIVFMPATDPDYSAKAWNPPVKPTRTWYVDSDAGDDAQDGLTPQTAWRTFKNTAGMELGPGERLLLKRGGVFNGDLVVSARGSEESWAGIGAYGEGMRPIINRNRHLNDRCGWVRGAAYLVVRDLVFCNAGSGFTVECSRPGDGHVLIERCLSHHIEGMYRFNSHGIPEWWDEPGAEGGSRSTGVAVSGRHARWIVMRDCESYQCSSGFTVSGVDTFVNRMYCHDNYAHNTSPHPYNLASRSWMTDCVFDASGWHAPAGTMGIMLAGNDGWIVRGCHFLNQPDSGSPDQGGIDFEAGGENCLVDRCTFRNNAGAAIEVLGLIRPQTRNVHIRACKFDRNNWSFKNGPAEIQVWGSPSTGEDIACSNGRIEGNGYVLVPGVPFYVNHSRTTNDWTLVDNREFDFAEGLDKAFPYVDPPEVRACGEIWTDNPVVALSARVQDGRRSENGMAVAPRPSLALAWEQIEGPAGVAFAKPSAACTKATFPGEGDYRVQVKADNGTLWRTSRTAVHVLPAGTRTFGAWDFSKPLDAQGWRAENTGTSYRFIPGKVPFWNTESFPVRLVCGDYYVIAMQNAAGACLVSSDDRDTGIAFTADRANTVRVKMMNHTDSARMRLWWQTDAEPEWKETNSVAFDVKPQDTNDTVYTVPMPRIGVVKQFRLSFSADGSPVTGTCRIDYIWAGRLPTAGNGF